MCIYVLGNRKRADARKWVVRWASDLARPPNTRLAHDRRGLTCAAATVLHVPPHALFVFLFLSLFVGTAVVRRDLPVHPNIRATLSALHLVGHIVDLLLRTASRGVIHSFVRRRWTHLPQDSTATLRTIIINCVSS